MRRHVLLAAENGRGFAVATAVSLRSQRDERRRERRGVEGTRRRREKVEKMRAARRVLLSLLARIRDAVSCSCEVTNHRFGNDRGISHPARNPHAFLHSRS